jgi:hypothetical protein
VAETKRRRGCGARRGRLKKSVTQLRPWPWPAASERHGERKNREIDFYWFAIRTSQLAKEMRLQEVVFKKIPDLVQQCCLRINNKVTRGYTNALLVVFLQRSGMFVIPRGHVIGKGKETRDVGSTGFNRTKAWWMKKSNYFCL